MDAPNRSAEVREVVARHPELVSDDDAKRRQMLEIIGAALNAIDGGQWGKLQKPGEADTKADILVWRDTREHFDVLTSAGAASWASQGRIRDEWAWIAFTPPPPNGDDDDDGGKDAVVTLLDDILTAVERCDIRLADELEPLVREHLATSVRIEKILRAAAKVARIPIDV